MKNRITKRIFSIFLAVLVCSLELSSSVVTAFAAENETVYEEVTITEENSTEDHFSETVATEEVDEHFSTVEENVPVESTSAIEETDVISTEDSDFEPITEAEVVMEEEIGSTEELELEADYSITGKFRLPDDSYVIGGGLKGIVYLYYQKGSSLYSRNGSFTIDDYDNREFTSEDEPLYVDYSVGFYNSDVFDTVYVRVKLTPNDKVVTNLYTYSTYKFTDGSVSTVSNAEELEYIVNDNSISDITLQKSMVAGVLKMPENLVYETENINNSLSVYIEAGYELESGQSSYTRDTYYVYKDMTEVYYNLGSVPFNAKKINYLAVRVTNNSSIKHNLYSNQYMYDAGTTYSNSKDDSKVYDISTQDILYRELTLPATKLKFNVKVPEGGIFSGTDLKGTIYYHYMTGGTSYSKYAYYTVKEGNMQDTVYAIELPLNVDDNKLTQLRIQQNSITNNAKTNLIVNKYFYYTSSGILSSDSSKSSEVAITTNVEKTLNLTLRKTAAFFKVKLGEGVYFSGGDAKGTIRVTATVNNSDKSYSNDFVISEGSDEADVYINSFDTDFTQIKKISYEFNNIYNLDTNLPDYQIYYNGTDWSNTEPAAGNYNLSDETPFEIAVNKPPIVPIKVSLATGAKLIGGQITGRVTVYYTYGPNGYSASAYKNFVIDSSTGEVEFEIPVYTNVAKIKNVYISNIVTQKAATNIAVKNYYLDISTASLVENSNSTTPVNFSNINSTLNINIPAYEYYVTGTISLPVGGYIKESDLTGGKISIRGNSTTMNADFVISRETGTATFMMPVVKDNAGGLRYIKVYYGNNNNSVTNIKTGNFYYDAEGNSYSVETVIPSISVGENIVNIVAPKSNSINGELKLPEGTYIKDGNVNVQVKVYDNNSYSSYQTVKISDPSQTAEYNIPIRDGAESISRIYVYITKDSNTQTNLELGTYNLDIDGTLKTSTSTYKEIAISSAETIYDLDLYTVPSISGKIKLSENAAFSGAPLSGSLTAYYGSGSSNSVSFTIPEGETEIPYLIALKKDAASISYLRVYLNSNSSLVTNMQIGANQYCDLNGKWSLNANTLTTKSLENKETVLDIVLPSQKTISGKIKVPEEGYFMGAPLAGKITMYAGSRAYSADYSIEVGATEAEYSIQLPAAAAEAEYVEITLNTEAETNLYTGRMYLNAVDKLTNNSSQKVPVPLNAGETVKDFEFDFKKLLKGNVIVPDGVVFETASNAKLDAKITAKINGLDYSYTAKIDGNSNSVPYEIELPQGTANISSLSVTIAENLSIRTNLLTGTAYYNASSNKWSSSYLEATAITTSFAINELDIVLQKAVSLHGTIKLSDDEYFKNAKLNGYVRAYTGSTSYLAYFSFDESERNVDYSIRMPLGAGNVSKIQIMVYSNSLLDTNVMLGKDMFLDNNGEWSVVDTTECQIELGEEGALVDLVLPFATTISGEISLPDGATDMISGKIGIEFGMEEYSVPFSIDNGKTKYNIVLPEGTDGDAYLYYRLDIESSDKYVTDKVYLNSSALSTKFAVVKEFAEKFEIAKGINTKNIDIATWNDCDTGSLLQSAHPYANDEIYKMGFEYPGIADGLRLNFSRYTATEDEFDTITIYSGSELSDENVVGTYAGKELAGQEVTVTGNQFTIVIDADMSRSNYGFGIDSIDVINGVPNADIAIGIVTENDDPTQIVVCNNTDNRETLYLSSACYTSNGKMVGLTSQKIQIAQGMASGKLLLENYYNAASGKAMLYDTAFTPVSECWFKIYEKNLIQFVYNDNTDTVRDVYLKDGEVLNKPSVEPSKLGYQFTGWYTTPQCEEREEYTFGSAIEDNLTLYAGWVKVYGVTLKKVGLGELEVSGLTDDKALKDTEIVIKAIPNTGYAFAGFDVNGIDSSKYTVDEESATLIFNMPSLDMEVTANFVKLIAVNWIESDVTVDEQMVLFDKENRMFIPEATEEVELTGNFGTLASEDIISVQYAYSYYDTDKNGYDAYVKGEPTDITLEEGSTVFIISGLKTGFGINCLEIRVTTSERIDTTEYYLVKNRTSVDYEEEVDVLDSNDAAAQALINNFVDNIVAAWDYDNDTPGDITDDGQVIILKKSSEFAQRLMLPEDDAKKLDTGNVWIIKPCDKFMYGYSFKIHDFGDAEYAPEAPEFSDFADKVFESDNYIYIIAVDPELSDITNDSISMITKGVNGIEFAMIPQCAEMDFKIIEEDGNVVNASVGNDEIELQERFPHTGFQPEQLTMSIVPEYSIKSDNITFKLNLNKAVIYDKDGDKDTTWDQIKLEGSFAVENLSVETAVDWHPIKDLDILPNQIGCVVDYTEKKDVKLTFGDTIKTQKGSDGVALSLSDIVKDAKKSMGLSTDNKIDIGKWSVEGVDMGNTIVLASVGFNLATWPPTAVGAGYSHIKDQSELLGIQPILVLMVCLDLDGSVSAKISIQYTQETYIAKGFNVQKDDFAGLSGLSKIGYLPTDPFNVSGYNVSIYNISQKSATNPAKSYGKITVGIEGEAKLKQSVSVGVALLLYGVNIAQVKGGIYAEKKVWGQGSIAFDLGNLLSKPETSLDGGMSTEIGLEVNAMAQVMAHKETWGGEIKQVGFKAPFSDKYVIYHDEISSVGLSGIVKEPAQHIADEDTLLSNVEVVAVEQKALVPKTFTAKTDTTGKYSIKGIGAGTFKVTYKKAGYKTVEETITIGNSSKTNDISLPLDKYMQVKGTVTYNNGTSEVPFALASIKMVSRSDSNISRTVKCNDKGEFVIGEPKDKISGVTPGVYKLTITGNGRKPIEKYIEVIYSEDGVQHLGAVTAVNATTGNRTVLGTIKDIATNRETGVKLVLQIREGKNANTGKLIKTINVPADGKYSVELPTGYYTFIVTDIRQGISDTERYYTSTENVTVSAINSQIHDLYVSQANNQDQIRIILRWGDTPRDLDSHLVGPTSDGSDKRFHTYYSNRSYRYGTKTYADLDVDIVTGRGPETTTIYYKNGDGIYSFYVHDFTNRSSMSSNLMSMSGATVQVSVGSSIAKTFVIPSNNIGTVWHVFDYNANTGEIIPVNTFSNVNGPSNVGLQSVDAEMSQEEADIAMIIEDIKEKDLEKQ